MKDNMYRADDYWSNIFGEPQWSDYILMVDGFFFMTMLKGH